jgi:16S rRNA (adenine1518-N6/adenine1519-N6)-dimethyltransferase
MKILKKIGKENFTPNPKIDSAVMSFLRKDTFSKELIHSVNLIFSFRRKKLQNIGKRLGIEIESNRRLEEMNNNEIIEFAKKIRKI